MSMPSGFRRFTSLEQAIAFNQDHGFRVTSPEDPDGTKGDVDAGRRLLALQEACDNGTYRVRLEDDNDNTDLSWDDTGEVVERLASGEYVCVGVVLERSDTWTNERTGEQRREWTSIDSVWNIIDTPDRAAKLAQCYAADWLPRE